MNRSAYLTTGLAIKLFSRLSKADIVTHGEENLPKGPTIFVINHFTRVETLLLPYYIYNITAKPVLSLAAAELFKGGLERFFDLVGVVSTADPERDKLILRNLLTGQADWIIFPEGRLVKTKKIIDGGKFMVTHAGGAHPPHTGAAALALRAELFRLYLEETAAKRPAELEPMLKALEIDGFAGLVRQPVTIVPVNLTYYPIRAAENIAVALAEKLVKDLSEQAMEEIMIEGTMLLAGVDLDIRFGKCLPMADYLDPSWFTKHLARDSITSFAVSPALKDEMRRTAQDVMQHYMHDIYAMTTVNHEHIFASLLRLCPFRRIRQKDFLLRAFYATTLISRGRKWEKLFYLHESLKENQAHLITDDRFGKFENFYKLAVEKKVVEPYNGYLLRDYDRLSAPLSFSRGRIDNTVEVIANEVEPLKPLLSLIRRIAWQPVFWLRYRLVRFLLHMEKDRYREDSAKVLPDSDDGSSETGCSGMPFILPSLRRRLGVVLVHSYLAVPEEVRELAEYLQKRGFWVYAPRLPGHGTSAEDLATRKFREWYEAVENGYVILKNICDRVVVGGVAVGGNLAFDLASRIPEVSGVFAVSPPYDLRNYSTQFMPVRDVWDRILRRMKRGEEDNEYFEFVHGNRHVNYPRNPVAGVREVGEYLDVLKPRYEAVEQPALLLQAADNPVVDAEGTRQIYDALSSADKEFVLLSFNRHVLVYGEGAEKVHRKVADFIARL